ncbi:MAG: WbuC family cupin fold metalloprotein [Methylacidiphilales bacterium]|nr:WbuC family cupin fold metalloprotein [Candidatus Methylacidiphilales bacterium]
MLQLKTAGQDVYITEAKFPNVGKSELDFLESKIESSARKRVRLCAHKSNDDRLHEMFIGFTKDSYIRPSKHLGKDESLHVIKGSGDYVFFDENGRSADVVSLGEYSSGFQFYCRIPESANHALVLDSDIMLIHETTSGPFKREDTVFTPWSPQENSPEVPAYVAGIKPARRERNLLKMNRINAEVYIADELIVSVGRKEMSFLKSKVSESERKRVRLCAHKDVSAHLHEMFVVYMDQTYVHPNKHLGKDESLHILEGEADFYFFNENGDITDIIPLGPQNSGRQFYIRVPAGVWHTLVMHPGTFVIHEATPGPFNREDTLWAPWAPDESNPGEAKKFLNRLKAAA